MRIQTLASIDFIIKYKSLYHSDHLFYIVIKFRLQYAVYSICPVWMFAYLNISLLT